MISLVARALVVLALAAASAYGTEVVAVQWAAGPGHALGAIGALFVCLVLAAAAILLALDMALDVVDANRLSNDLRMQRNALDRLSVIR